MASLFLIAPIAVIFCMIAVAAWIWASNSGQFDDLDREGSRILFDEDLPPEQRRPAAGKPIEPAVQKTDHT